VVSLEAANTRHQRKDTTSHLEYTPLISLPASDAEYVVKQPAAKVAQKINGYKTCERPHLEIVESTFEQLPTLYNIVNQLAKLPNHGIIESGIYDLQEVRFFCFFSLVFSLHNLISDIVSRRHLTAEGRPRLMYRHCD